VIEE
jgi:hypothetical protein